MHRKILFSIMAVTSVTNAFESLSLASKDLSSDQHMLNKEFEYNGRDFFEEWPNEEIIYNHLDAGVADEEKSSNHPILEGTPQLKIDRLCSSSNTVGNVCTILDKKLRFSSDVFYKTDLTLVFDNSKIKCLTISYAPCSFMIEMTGGKGAYLELKNSSVVTGKQIIIAAKDSEVIIGEDSSIWASGQSISIFGTQKDGLGANFIGQAGYC